MDSASVVATSIQRNRWHLTVSEHDEEHGTYRTAAKGQALNP